MTAFNLYLLGIVAILIGGVYAATLLHVPTAWIVVGALVVIGLGIMGGVSKTKSRDLPSQDQR